jgi:hypothetical protein
MDFLFSGFIEFKNTNGDPVYVDASKITVIEQNHFDENACAVVLDGIGRGIMVPMSAAELRRKISEIRARGQKTLRALLK